MAALNYLKPHKNWIVFLIAECSFLLSTFKYLALVLLNSPGTAEQGSQLRESSATAEKQRRQDYLGTLLMVLDIVFVLGSTISIIALTWLLRKDMTKSLVSPTAMSNAKSKNFNKKIVPMGRSVDVTSEKTGSIKMNTK